MSSEVPLSDIAEIIMGQSPKKSEVNTDGHGVPLLNGPTEFTTRHPQPIQFTESGRKFAEKGDILFCVRGSTTGRMNYADQRYAIGRGIGAIRGKNGFPTEYVRALLEQNLNHLLQAATGSTFPNVGRETLNNFKVNTVEASKAQQINELIVSLESKSYLNQQTNQTLEQIAQAIFKSWFVDFDPVKAKMNALKAGGSEEDALLATMQAISGKDKAQLTQLQSENPERYNELRTTAELFPSAMQDSEVGEIPEGWEIDKLAKLISFNPRRTLKKGTPAPYLDMKNVPTSGHLAEEVVIREMKSGTKFINGDTLLARITPCLENGKTAYVDFLEQGQVGWGSTEYIVMRAQDSYPKSLSYFIARDSHFREHAIRTMTGTSGRQRANAKALADLPWVVYPLGLVNAFNKLARPYLDIAKRNGDESQTLSAMRNTLLPKLLSDEVQVNSTDRASTKLLDDKLDHDLSALVSEIENDLPPKSHFVVHESSRNQSNKLGMIGFSTKITGALAEGGAEYFKLPAFLRALRNNKALEKLFAATVEGISGVPFLMDGATAILNKFLGKKIKFDQRIALVLLAFPKELTRETQELLEKARQLCVNAGLPPIDETQLLDDLNQLRDHGLVIPLGQKLEEWRLVEKFNHEIDNWS